MAKFKVSDDAKTRKPYVLMPEGDHILEVTKAEVKPARRPKYISIEAVNEDGVTIRNRWDVTNETQESMFWLFYNTGCGMDTDEDGFADVDGMVGKFALVSIKHATREAQEFEDEETGEVKKYPARTFANFAYIHGNVEGFDDVEPAAKGEVADDNDSDDEDENPFD